MKKILYNILLLAVATITFTSCNLFGLDLQENADYNYSPIKKTMDITAFEFIESRKNIDMFLLYEAIIRADYRDEYEQFDRTFIVLNDDAFTNYLSEKRFTGLQSMTVKQIQTMLDSYIIKGRYHALDLSTTPVEVELLNPDTRMFLSLKSQDSDVSDKFLVMINEFTGSKKATNVVTSNLQPTNGIMHVVGNFPEYVID